MAQFDVYRVSNGDLVLDVQTDLLAGFHSRVTVPLMRPELAPPPHRRLNPQVTVDGEPYRMVTQFMLAVHSRELQKPIANLGHRYDDIKAALDMIFLGF